MSKKANASLIGLFVIGAVVLMAAVVLLLGSGRLFQQTDRFVTHFEGSVAGLEEGSMVRFRGVPVGSVVEVFAAVERDTLDLDVFVVFEVDPNAVRDPSGLPRDQPTEEVLATLVERGLRTKLTPESLVTGQYAVEMDFYPEYEAVYKVPPTYADPEIPSVPSDWQQLQEVAEGMLDRIDGLEVEELLARAVRTLESLDRLLNSEEIMRILRGVERLVSSEDTQALPGDLRAAVGRLDATLEDSQKLVRNLDSRVEPLAADLHGLSDQLEQTLVEAQETLQGVQDVTDADSELIHRSRATLEETERAMRSLRVFLDYLEQHPEALVRGKARP